MAFSYFRKSIPNHISVFNKIIDGYSGSYNTITPLFEERIYICKKDDIDPKFNEADSQIVVDLNPAANIQLDKIAGHFEAKSKSKQTVVGLRFRETISIDTSLMSAELKYRLTTVLGNLRLCVITIREDSPVELYGAAMGLAVESSSDDHNIKFETTNGFGEPGMPKEIWIATTDGSRSIAATIAEIERIASR